MLIPSNELPLEIWEIIFSHVVRAKDLAECRLVCKVWDPLAEKALFSQDLFLPSESKVVSFCDMIKQKPLICKYIRHLRLDGWDQLPVPLQGTLFNYFGAFTNLEALELTPNSRHDLSEINSILAKCPHLKLLDLIMQHVSLPRTNDGDFEQWLLENVKQATSVDDIMISCKNQPSGFVDYLMFKFPNVSRVFTSSVNATASGAVQRILKTVQTIPDIEFDHWWMNDLNDVKSAFVALRRSKNVVAIRPCSNASMTTGAMALGFHTDQKKDRTVFRVYVPKNLLLQTLAIVKSTVGLSGKVELDYRDNTEPNLTHDNIQGAPSAFEMFLTMIPFACKIKYFDTHVFFYQSFDANTILPSLQGVEFCGSIIGEEVLSALSQVAPHLKHLTLNTCILDAMFPHNYYIDMPSSDLAVLSIIAKQNTLWDEIKDAKDAEFEFADERTAALDFIKRCIEIRKAKQFVSLYISTLSTKQHFILESGSPTTIFRVKSGQDYLRYTAAWPNIVIKCKLLKVLTLNLGELMMELKLADMDRPIESRIKDWRVSCRVALLQRIYPFD